MNFFFVANVLFGEVSGVGVWRGATSCLPHFRPGEGEVTDEGRKALVPAWLGVAFSRWVWSSVGARQGYPRLSGQDCRRMWGKEPFACDESCRSPAGCSVWQQR